jgi:hypothetical protein
MAFLAGSSGGQLTKGTWSGGCGNHYGVGPGDLIHVEAVESWGDPTLASVAWSVEVS